MASLTRWTWVWVNSRSWWWTGRPGVLRFMGSQRVGHDWATELNWTEIKLSFQSIIFYRQQPGLNPGLERSPGGGYENQLYYSWLENPRDKGTWQAAVHKIRKSWTQLKRLSKHLTKTFICHCNKIFPLFIVCLKNKKELKLYLRLVAWQELPLDLCDTRDIQKTLNNYYPPGAWQCWPQFIAQIWQHLSCSPSNAECYWFSLHLLSGIAVSVLWAEECYWVKDGDTELGWKKVEL